MKLTKSRIQKTEAVAVSRQAGRGGQKAVSFRTDAMEKRVDVGKGGREAVKWTGFSHLETALTRLFAHISTQVVDFPHLAMVSIFCDGHEIGFSRLSREVAI